MAGGYCLHRCLRVVADLGVADFLDGNPKSAAELPASVGAHPEALARTLRLLASHGVFERQGERFAHSPASQLLRSDHPQSMRDLARMFGLPIMWSSSGALDHSVRTGEPAAERGFPGGF